MTKESTDLLFKSYRKLFPPDEVVNDITKNLIGSFGFEVREGWFNLLNELFVRMEKLQFEDDPFYIVQVKEKFAGLRVYTTHGTDELYNLLEEYENLSYTICENCGSQGKVTGQHWLVTLCDKCVKYREDELMKMRITK